jgi:hypothetical protein
MDPTVYALGKNVRAYCDVLSEYPIATKSSIEQENVLNNHDSLIVKKRPSSQTHPNRRNLPRFLDVDLTAEYYSITSERYVVQ